jgi:hypothetical protein
MGEIGMACTVGLVGASLLTLKYCWNEDRGEILRRENVEREIIENQGWTFSNCPSELFVYEDQWNAYKNGGIELSEEEIVELKENIAKYKQIYNETLDQFFTEKEYLSNFLMAQEDLDENKIVCLAGFITTETNSGYIDTIIDKLESKIEQYGQYYKHPETGIKFDNLLKLVQFCHKQRHRLFYERRLHENLTILPQNVDDVTFSINKRYNKEEKAIFIKLEELYNNLMCEVKLRESEEIIFSGIFLIGDEI